MYIPYHKNFNHWTFFMIDMKTRTIQYYDPWVTRDAPDQPATADPELMQLIQR